MTRETIFTTTPTIPMITATTFTTTVTIPMATATTTSTILMKAATALSISTF